MAKSLMGYQFNLTIKRLVSPMIILLIKAAFFSRREAVVNTHETVFCIFNSNFTGCEVVSISAE